MSVRRVVRDQDGQITGVEVPDSQLDTVAITMAVASEQAARQLADAARALGEASARDLDAIRMAESERWSATIESAQARVALREAASVTATTRDRLGEATIALAANAYLAGFEEGAAAVASAAGLGDGLKVSMPPDAEDRILNGCRIVVDELASGQ